MSEEEEEGDGDGEADKDERAAVRWEGHAEKGWTTPGGRLLLVPMSGARWVRIGMWGEVMNAEEECEDYTLCDVKRM